MADTDNTAITTDGRRGPPAGPRADDAGRVSGTARDPLTAHERLDGFISYARRPADREFVDWLSGELAGRGKQIWMDRSHIEPAADWRARIARGIELANAFIFVVSPGSAASAECMAELTAAVAQHKRIVPVVLRQVPPGDLPASVTTPNWIDFQDRANTGTSVDRLLEALDADLEWRDTSTRLAARAREWNGSGKDRSFLLRGTDLKTAEAWYEDKGAHQEQPTDEQYTYLAASRRGASRRLRLGLTAALCALAVAIALSVVALVQRNAADSSRRLALARQYAAQSADALSSDPARSVSLALSALRTHRTAGGDNALRQAMAHFQLLRTIKCTNSPTTAVASSPDGSKIAIGTSTGIIQVWDARTLVKIWQVTQKFVDTGSPLGYSIQTLEFNPGSTELLSSSHDGTARLWDAWTGAQLGYLLPPGNNEGLSTAHFSPSGTLVVTATTQGQIATWDSRTGKRLASWAAPAGGHSGTLNNGLTSALFSPAGNTVITAGGDGTVRVWQAGTGRQLLMLKVPLAEEAIFTPNGSEIATTTQDGTIALWRTSTGHMIRVLAKSASGGWDHLAFLFHGRLLTASGGTAGTAETWLASDGQELAQMEEPGGSPINDAAPSPSGTELITVSDDGTARFWNPLPRQLLQLAVAPGQVGFDYATFSPDGSAIATADNDGTASIWNLRTGAEPFYRIEGTSGPAYAGAGNGIELVSFNKNGTELLTASTDGNVKVFNLHTGSRVETYQNTNPVVSAQFSADGSKVFFLTARHHAYIYETGNHLTANFVVIAAKADAANSAANVTNDAQLNRAGNALVTAGYDGSIIVWNVGTGKRLDTFFEPGHSPVASAVFSPHGGKVLTASIDGTARIWNLRSRKQILMVREPGGGRLSSAAFSPDGRSFVTSSADGTAAIWSASTGTRLATFALPGGPGLSYAQFNRAGNAVLTNSGGFLAVWSTKLAMRLSTLTTQASSELRNSLGPAAEAPSLPNQVGG